MRINSFRELLHCRTRSWRDSDDAQISKLFFSLSFFFFFFFSSSSFYFILFFYFFIFPSVPCKTTVFLFVLSSFSQTSSLNSETVSFYFLFPPSQEERETGDV